MLMLCQGRLWTVVGTCNTNHANGCLHVIVISRLHALLPTVTPKPPPLRRYLCYLLFQLKTHSQFFSEGGDDAQPALSLAAALAVLTGITVVVAVCSECAGPPCMGCLTRMVGSCDPQVCVWVTIRTARHWRRQHALYRRMHWFGSCWCPRGRCLMAPGSSVPEARWHAVTHVLKKHV